MGYTTDFMGQFDSNKKISWDLASKINEFSETRHEGLEFPGIWCQWIVNEDRTGIVWDGGEKFYEYEKWLTYIIEHFLAPKKIILNGQVRYRGEEMGDDGYVIVENNVVSLATL